MKNNLSYHPLTAFPFKKDTLYTELPPCKELLPYVRCYWGTAQPVLLSVPDTSELVIPDTCVDILYYIDYTDNSVSGGFCGINDHSVRSHGMEKCGHLAAVFAIRFYS